VRRQHALVLADCSGLVVRPIEGRLALKDNKGVVFVGVGVQPVLAVRRVGLQHDPHLFRGSERRIGAALLRKLRLQLKEGWLIADNLRLHLGAEILRTVGDAGGSIWRHGGLLIDLR